jgi:hypothetical protein
MSSRSSKYRVVAKDVTKKALQKFMSFLFATRLLSRAETHPHVSYKLRLSKNSNSLIDIANSYTSVQNQLVCTIGGV